MAFKNIFTLEKKRIATIKPHQKSLCYILILHSTAQIRTHTLQIKRHYQKQKIVQNADFNLQSLLLPCWAIHNSCNQFWYDTNQFFDPVSYQKKSDTKPSCEVIYGYFFNLSQSEKSCAEIRWVSERSSGI